MTSLDTWLQAPKRTRVVHLKRTKDKITQDCEVYIGRECQMGGWNLERSVFANPFSVDKHGRKECIRQYEVYIRNQPWLMARIPELKGKTLGCWCAPLPCHGDVLVKLVNELTQ